MTRFPDWQNRLVHFLKGTAKEPFEEGQRDCALFLADGVRVMTGTDYAEPFRGRYTTTRGGLRVLRRAGYNDHVELARAHLREVPVAFLKPGDGAVVAEDGQEALGIVQGAWIYLRGPKGLIPAPLSRAHIGLEV
ncbi:MAG: hypothetical protein AAGM84_05645 [Pseudomonadota bacterium]